MSAMSPVADLGSLRSVPALVPGSRAAQLFEERYRAVATRVDRLFLVLMLIQWAAAIGLALWLSPLAWSGMDSSVHEHVYAALVLGGLITVPPVALTVVRPGATLTRYVVACAQMLWGALLIHLTGGRIETHFHIFGSLAILAFYRDLYVLLPATVVVAADHFLRGLYWPESVYGVANPEWWRFLEHAGWVLFIDTFLILNCLGSRAELVSLCHQQAELEATHEQVLRVERLAAIGELAASVGHELRNPLSAVRNAQTFIGKRLKKAGGLDPKVEQFLGVMDRELDASFKIISDLLDYSRAKDPAREPCPVGPLVDEAMRLVPVREGVTLVNAIDGGAPVPELDHGQFRQVFINLIQNGSEAMAEAGRRGSVTVSLLGGGTEPWTLTVDDEGPGFEPDARARIFQPLFSTKTKGTGLGLAVVQGVVERHGGTIHAADAPGGGARFVVELPPMEATRAEAAE